MPFFRRAILAIIFLIPAAWADSDGYYCTGGDYLAYQFGYAAPPIAPHRLYVVRLGGEQSLAEPAVIQIPQFQVRGMVCGERTIQLEALDAVYTVSLDTSRRPIQYEMSPPVTPTGQYRNLGGWSTHRLGFERRSLLKDASGNEFVLEIVPKPSTSNRCEIEISTSLLELNRLGRVVHERILYRGMGAFLPPFPNCREDALSSVPEGVERYARDMAVVMKASGPLALEPAFAEGLSAAKALERDQMERLKEPAYRQVQSMMVGFLVGREEVVVAAPLADFFLKLAREKGTGVDRAYFETLKKTYPDGYWPAYNNRQTDYSGCTIFDGETLTGLYGGWIAFQKVYPGQYREAAQKELANIEDALGSTCACAGEDGVQKELENFLKAYPNSPLADKVAARLRTIRDHTSEIRPNCMSD